MPERNVNQPNIVFVISHDIAPSYGCYGGQAVSPHVDRLAEEGVTFENHFCHWPLCGPSRANLFSGCRPMTTKRFNNQPFFPEFRTRMGSDFASLPEHFRNNGYHARGYGLVYHDVPDPPSWDVPLWRPPEVNETARRHRDLPDVLVSGWIKDWVTDSAYEIIRNRWHALQEKGYSVDDLANPTVARRAQGPAVECADVDDDAYFDGKVTSQAVRFIAESARSAAPFFLAVGLVSGHTPFRAPRRYWELYDRDRLQLPAFRAPPLHTPEWAMGDSEPSQYYTTHGYERPWRASEAQSLELLHAHLATMSYTDAQLGRLTDALRAAGLYENTIVVMISDHGFTDGEHGYWGKHNVWDRALHLPFVIRIPDGLQTAAGPATPPVSTPVAPGARQRGGGWRVDQLTEHTDVYPTLCELAGIPVPPHVEGTSVLPILSGNDAARKHALFAHRKHMWHDRVKAYDICNSIRTERYRYSEYVDAAGGVIHKELFDYQIDPDETVNHATDPVYQAVRDELAARLGAGWQAEHPRRW